MTLERAKKSFGKYIGSLISSNEDLGMIIDIQMDGGPKDSDKYPLFVIEWYTNHKRVLYKDSPSWHTVTSILVSSYYKLS